MDGRMYVQIPPVFYRTSSLFGAEAQKGKKRKEETSRPKARDGHRYPCPAERFVYGSLASKLAFGPEGGRSPVEHRGICTYILRALKLLLLGGLSLLHRGFGQPLRGVIQSLRGVS